MKKISRCMVILSCLFSLSGCATVFDRLGLYRIGFDSQESSHTHVQEEDMLQKHISGTYFLNHSLYLSNLYDDDRFDLATALKPAELDLLRGLGGEDVLAPEPHTVLAPGTEIQITRIEPPTAQHMWRRPFLTPRYHTWVFLTAAAAPGETSLQHQKPIILLFPPEVKGETELAHWISTYLSREDITKSVNQLAAEVRDAVKSKDVIKGMSEDEVRLSWGSPTEIIELGNTEKQKVILFGKRRVILTNGKVSSIIVR